MEEVEGIRRRAGADVAADGDDDKPASVRSASEEESTDSDLDSDDAICRVDTTRSEKIRRSTKACLMTKEVTPARVEPFLRTVRLFRTLPASEWATLVQELVTEEFCAGDTIIKQGETGNSMYILWSGECSGHRSISSTAQPTTGEERHERFSLGRRSHLGSDIHHYRSGDWFGERVILEPCRVRGATVVCDTKVKVLRLDSSAFQKMRGATKHAMRMLSVIRYADQRQEKSALFSVIVHLVAYVVMAILFWPLVTAWSLFGPKLVESLCKATGFGTESSLTALVVASGIVLLMLNKMLPVIRVGVDCAVQLLVLNELPPWQVAFVEKAEVPLMRIGRLAIWYTVLCLPGIWDLIEHVIPFDIKYIRLGTTSFGGDLWCAISSAHFAGYLRDIAAPPEHIEGDRLSASGTWARSIERYYVALQNPREFEDEFFADLAGAINRVLSGLIALCAAQPWLNLFGIKPAQAMALGGFGSIAFGFASKEVLENLVSGALLTISKPFVQGDRLRTEDNKFKGVVRKVGFAYSQINKDDGETLMVPNSVLLKQATVNMSRRRFRVVSATFPVVLAEFDRLPALCELVQKVMADHPDVISGETFHEMKKQDPQIRIFEPQCTFGGYGAQGAEVEVLAYTPAIRDPRFMQIRSEVLLSVNDAIAKFGGAIGLRCATLASDRASVVGGRPRSFVNECDLASNATKP